MNARLRDVELFSEIERLVSQGTPPEAIRRRVFAGASEGDVQRWAEQWVAGVIGAAVRAEAAAAEQRSERLARKRGKPATDTTGELTRSPGWHELTLEQQELLLERRRRRDERNAAAHAAWWASLAPEDRAHHEMKRESGFWDWQVDEQLEADTWQANENLKASIRLELTEELLSAKIALGDGTVVTWGEATPAQLRQRAALLLAMAQGDIKTAARLESAADMIEASGVTCLNDLDGGGAG